jgi:hypothetical protein
MSASDSLWKEADISILLREDILTLRVHERLYIRWTDAPAVYTNGVDDKEYEHALCRAVQLFKNCIVLRRLLDDAAEQVTKVSPTLS